MKNKIKINYGTIEGAMRGMSQCIVEMEKIEETLKSCSFSGVSSCSMSTGKCAEVMQSIGGESGLLELTSELICLFEKTSKMLKKARITYKELDENVMK